jgi:hypothetical protein
MRWHLDGIFHPGGSAGRVFPTKDEMAMHISRSLTNNDHSIRFAVTNHRRGWKVRQEEDARTVSDVVYDDWHRVERAVSSFDRKAAALRTNGWIDNGTSGQGLTGQQGFDARQP